MAIAKAVNPAPHSEFPLSDEEIPRSPKPAVATCRRASRPGRGCTELLQNELGARRIGNAQGCHRGRSGKLSSPRGPPGRQYDVAAGCFARRPPEAAMWCPTPGGRQTDLATASSQCSARLPRKLVAQRRVVMAGSSPRAAPADLLDLGGNTSRARQLPIGKRNERNPPAKDVDLLVVAGDAVIEQQCRCATDLRNPK